MSIISRRTGLGIISALTVAGAAQAADVAYVELEGALLERPDPFAWLSGESQPTLLDAVRAFEAAAEDEDLDGVLIRLKDAPLGMTQIEELSAALQTLRDAGKRVDLFAENYGNGEMLLGAACDGRLIQAGGSLSFSGVYMEEMYLADMLGWLGIKADLVQVGDYKGANETMTRTGPSEAWDQTLSGLLDGMYAHMKSSIADGYGLSKFDDTMSQAWLTDGARGVELGLLSAEVDLPDLRTHLSSVYGSEIDWSNSISLSAEVDGPDMSNPFAIFSVLSEEPEFGPKSRAIAVLHINGAIVDGDSTAASAFGSASVGSRTIRRAIEDIIDEDLIRGVVVRVNSPGGSAIASEVMWQGIQRLKGEGLPVWVSVGNMAASGGYYVAVAGDKIYANDSSIVGSIGVVGGKYSLGGLYKKLNVNIVNRSRGPNAAMFASDDTWTNAQRELVRKRMTQTYDLFTSRVTAGRPDIDLSEAAEGRIFTGDRANELAMVDSSGGLSVALDDMADAVDLDSYEVVHYPGPKSFQDLLEETFGGFMGLQAPSSNSPLALLRDLIGADRLRRLAPAIEAFNQLRSEPVILAAPHAFSIKLKP